MTLNCSVELVKFGIDPPTIRPNWDASNKPGQFEEEKLLYKAKIVGQPYRLERCYYYLNNVTSLTYLIVANQS